MQTKNGAQKPIVGNNVPSWNFDGNNVPSWNFDGNNVPNWNLMAPRKAPILAMDNRPPELSKLEGDGVAAGLLS